MSNDIYISRLLSVSAIGNCLIRSLDNFWTGIFVGTLDRKNIAFSILNKHFF